MRQIRRKVSKLSVAKSAVRSLCLALCCAPVAAIAQDQSTPEFPRVGGNIIFRLGYNGDYNSDPPLIETQDVFLDMIASPVFHFSERLRFNTEVRMETIVPPVDDRVFEDEGIFARILQLEYDVTDRLSIHAGKMTPDFARASFWVPGMFGNSYNREIELIDQVGFGGSYRFGGRGNHTLSFNTFFEDTSFTSASLINNRGGTSLEDGGASNTESFESFAFSLEGSDIERFPGLTYNLGYVHRAQGVDGVADENGVVVSLMQSFDTTRGENWTLIGELAALENFEGSADDIVYASAGVVYRQDRWMSISSGTFRPRNVENGEDFDDDYTLQLSVEYDLGQGWSAAIGHEWNRESGADNQTLGLRLSRVIDLG
ncbi:MAG: hypothetical protein AAGF88_11070 [Pseudomonadota bacterium]